jgi:AraC-like DNA-binding protein
MKPAFEITPQWQWESFHCEVLRGSSYKATWHFHPEYQLTLVLKSSGYRLVGDRIMALRPGDLVLVGSNLPHVWRQDESGDRSPSAMHAIVVRFLDTFLGRNFLEIPEMEPVLQLLKRAKRGLQVTGRTREIVAAKLERLPGSQGLQRVADMVSILDTLARSPHLKPIASPGFAPCLVTADQGRVERVISFIYEHLTEQIDRAAVAAQAHLSVGAFSRFFKLRTGKMLPEYVNELRVGRACQRLAEEQLKVTEIALQCGFNNLANFNRCFHRITGMAPVITGTGCGAAPSRGRSAEDTKVSEPVTS